MKIIGLTGGIGSGKSAIAGYLRELGAAVIDADKVGHDLFERDTPGYSAVVTAFGRDVLKSDGTIDRKKLARIVFSHPAALEKLNQILHPRILQEVQARLQKYQEQGYPLAVVEAALLIEAGWVSQVDEVWLAIAPPDQTLQRLQKRGLPESEALARLAAQVPGEGKRDRATVIINNDGSLADLKAKVVKLWNQRHNKDKE